jgi:hypothetical protein
MLITELVLVDVVLAAAGKLLGQALTWIWGGDLSVGGTETKKVFSG